MRRAFPHCVILAAIAAASGACSASNAPAATARNFRLVSYGGAALPVVLRRIVETSTQPGGSTTNCDDKLTASTLLLLDAGRFAQADSHLLVCDDGRRDVASQASLQGTYQAGADTVVLDADLGGGTHYVSLARLSGGALTIYRREGRTDRGATAIDPTPLVFEATTN